MATLIVWNRKNDLCVIDHWHHNTFLSLFFFCYTYKADICGWFSPSPTMHQHPEKQHWTTTTFTHLCPTLPKRSKAKNSNQRRTMSKKQTKKTNYKYLPCWYLNKWKGDQHSIQKYHNFIYQMASVGSCSGLHSYKEMLIDRISIFFPSFHPRLPLAVPIVQRTMHSCIWPDLSSSGFVNHLFFFFSHYKTTILFTYFQV